MDLGFPLIDADTHYYEPPDCFSRHIEAEYRDRTVRAVYGDDGLGRLFIGSERMVTMSVMPGDFTGAPGALQGLFMGKVVDGFTQRELINAKDYPAFTSRGSRVELMDQQGVEASVILPTLGVAVEHDMRHDLGLMYASLRAFNRWLEEDWGYGEDGRIFSVPLLSLRDLGEATKELERVVEKGAKIVHLVPGPVDGRSPADPFFDPFWARAAEAGVAVAFHVSCSGYNDYYGVHWGEDPKNPSHRQSPLQWVLCNTERPIVDTLAALTLHNLFGRHPDIKILSIENGSAWLRPLLKSLDKAVALGARGPNLGGPLPDRASDMLKEHLWVCPFVEEDVVDAIEAIGADHVLFGSDYPHPEGLRNPADFADSLAGCSPHTVKQVMRVNSATLLGIPGDNHTTGPSAALRVP